MAARSPSPVNYTEETVRRSFISAYTNSRTFQPPNTPANSPCDFGRCYVGKADSTCRQNCEEKENDEKNYSLMRAKNCKNFMSPTISAASKFTPSPRKKVLSERNDPIRASFSLSNGKPMFSESKRNKNPPSGDSVLFSASDSTVVAPLDADPSLPPYDPNTNYLSPRPRFLRYKPNPRTELLLNRETGLDHDCFKQLEDNFMAEILSDNFTLSDSDDLLETPEEEEEPHVSEASESCPIPADQKNEKKKSRGFSRSMCFVLILTLLIAVVFSFHPEDLSLSDVSNLREKRSRIVTQATEEFHWLVSHANHLSNELTTFISRLADEFQRSGNSEKVLLYMNISDLQNNMWDQQYVMNNDFKKVDAIQESDPEEAYEIVISDPVSLPDLEITHAPVSEHEPEVEFETVVDIPDPALLPEPDNLVVTQVTTAHDLGSISEPDMLLADPASLPEGHDSKQEAANEVPSEPEKAKEALTVLQDNDELVQIPVQQPRTNYHAMEVSSILTAALMAVAFFIHQYKRRIPSSSTPAETDANLSKNVSHAPATPLGGNNTYKEKKLQTEEEDLGETSSCTSKMRSSLKTSSYIKKDMEEEGSENKASKRRESLASSTGGSPSYGSFTTFEKIPVKNANGEEEIITPVRRSSRIRYHQMSPP